MIAGLETGIDALSRMRRILASNSERHREAMLDQLIRSLYESDVPFLVSLAEALEDGLIHSAD